MWWYNQLTVWYIGSIYEGRAVLKEMNSTREWSCSFLFIRHVTLLEEISTFATEDRTMHHLNSLRRDQYSFHRRCLLTILEPGPIAFALNIVCPINQKQSTRVCSTTEIEKPFGFDYSGSSAMPLDLWYRHRWIQESRHSTKLFKAVLGVVGCIAQYIVFLKN